jgi:YCII-related domain
MLRRGVLRSGAGLRPPAEATTVRVPEDDVLLSDGPFAETKEQIGGFCLIECAGMDEAIAFVGRGLADRKETLDGGRGGPAPAGAGAPGDHRGRRSAANAVKADPRGNFNRLADRLARRDAAGLTADELTASLADNVEHPWKPPRGGYAGALTHDVVHGLDLVLPLGLDRRVPMDRLRRVPEGLANPAGLRYFGVDLHGVSLEADKLDWTYGSGAPLTGSAEALTALLRGRRLPPGLLTGEPAARFTRPKARRPIE